MSSDVGTTTRTLSDETLSRRRYFREKQREYRRKLIADGAAIEAEVFHLQSILDGLQAKSLPFVREARNSKLSWRSIAMVFKSEAHRVLTDRESLVTKMQELESLKRAMQNFVMMNIAAPPMSRSNNVTWPSATLVADPSARNLGKKWLTQQMYHNMHDAFALFPVVGDDEDFYQFDFQASVEHDDPFTFVERLQCKLPGTLASFRRVEESHRMRDTIVTEEVVANTRLLCTTTADGEFINTLKGHFVEADRYVIVSRTEVRQVSPTHILMRTVCQLSRSFRAYDGFVSADELAVLRGIDVTGIEDDDQKDEYVRRELIRWKHAQFLVWRQRFTALMQEHDTTP
ncbi:hypothetical protein DYB25_013765 [Aphanomyces astaci]|uniref:Uncharacterized protein n=1 Tax=Aphanomyces astaci TaxID=112090 RepID=A0A397AD63_APHAT|nr:hypothetical protein DYB25_013765 [Aphanomyces astaci]